MLRAAVGAWLEMFMVEVPVSGHARVSSCQPGGSALSPVIGYDKSATISYYAIDHNLSLKQAALAKGVSEELFDKVVQPLALTRPGSADTSAASGRS